MSGFPWDHSLTHSPRSFTFPNIQLPVVRCYHLMWRHYGSYLSLDLPAVHTGFGYTEPITGITWVWTCLLLTIQSFDFTKLITGLNWVLLCPLSIQGFGYTEFITGLTWRCTYTVWLYGGHYGFYLTLSKHGFDYKEDITGVTWRRPYKGLVIQMSPRVLPDAVHTGFDYTELVTDFIYVSICLLLTIQGFFRWLWFDKTHCGS